MDDRPPVFHVASPELTGRRRDQLLTLYDLDRPDAGTIDELGDIVDLARRVTGADASQLNVLGGAHQFTLNEAGLGGAGRQIPLSGSVCSAVLEQRGTERLIVIPDTVHDPLLRDHPAVTGDPGMGFYAGVPLTSTSGWPIGMLCVWSTSPARLDETQSGLLRQLGNAAMHILESRRRTGNPTTNWENDADDPMPV